MLDRAKAAARHYHRRLMDALHAPLRRGQGDPYHATIQAFNDHVNALDRPRILEIGSRNVTGVTNQQHYPNCGQYVGFDIHPGPGVDVVGDVHRLGDCFAPGRFDVVLAFSVFEHLLFPWKAVLEINRVMRVGGRLLITTHPVWPEHEMPWDFWRFPKGGFTGLLNGYTGFAIEQNQEGLPAQAYSLHTDRPTRGLANYTLNQGVAVWAIKTGEYRADLLKWDVEVSQVTSTAYPTPPSPK